MKQMWSTKKNFKLRIKFYLFAFNYFRRILVLKFSLYSLKKFTKVNELKINVWKCLGKFVQWTFMSTPKSLKFFSSMTFKGFSQKLNSSKCHV